MSLNQKYTWGDFLKANPELKKKGIKRTSKEGAKAFDETFKAQAKTHLKEQMAKWEREVKKATTRRDGIVQRLKTMKKTPDAKIVQARAGQKDHAISALQHQIERAKAAQKSL